jgi:hypothetical protein
MRRCEIETGFVGSTVTWLVLVKQINSFLGIGYRYARRQAGKRCDWTHNFAVAAAAAKVVFVTSPIGLQSWKHSFAKAVR